MISRTARRRLAIGAGVLVALVVGWCAFVYFRPARHLFAAKLTKLGSGRSVLVVEEVLGSSVRSDQLVRFDVFDAKSGDHLHRLLPSFFAASDGLESIGGGSRQWWANGTDCLLLLDVEAGKVVADRDAVIDANPVLRGELHRTQSSLFGVDTKGALIVKGGDGGIYAVDGATLTASAIPSVPQLLARPNFGHALPREIMGRTDPDPPFGLSRVCRTISDGPCGLRLRRDDAIAWELSPEALDGKTVLSVEARDTQTAYVYVARDTLIGRFIGGTWIYAVDLASGKVSWKAKL